MPDLTAKRTLVKSPPELWSEVSDLERLARHLGAFGEIKITKLEPEHTVAWEGEAASGTVSIEPSGWGTKVTLTAELAEEPEEAAPEPEAIAPVEEPEPVAVEPEVVEPEPIPPEVSSEDAPVEARRKRGGFFAWLFRPRSLAQETPPAEESEPEAPKEEPVAVESEPEAVEAEPVADEPAPLSAPEVEPVAVKAEPEPPSEPADEDALDARRAQAILDDALDALGSAHHRPFSRG